MAAAIQTKRTFAGNYTVTSAGRNFEVEDFGRAKVENGDANTYRAEWILFEILNGRREYCNDFCTLSDAKDAIGRIVTAAQ